MKLLAPQSEACPEGIYVSLLTLLGNLFGTAAHCYLGLPTHRCNLFICNAGMSGCGRKGTNLHDALWILEQAGLSPTWTGGLSSGEGLIAAVNDLRVPLVFVETEFGGTLGNIARQYNNLCSVMKQAWDGQRLAIQTKNSPYKCDGAHVSVVSHITYGAIEKLFQGQDVENGLANRFLWVHTYRSRLLPRGPRLKQLKLDMMPVAAELARGVEFARKDLDAAIPMLFSLAAEDLWDQGGLYASPVRRGWDCTASPPSGGPSW